MSFLDLYQGDIDQAAKQQPNEGSRLPSTFEENFHAAWSNGLMFSQSIARENARGAVLSDYFSEIRAKTGNDLSQIQPIEGGGPDILEQANARVAKIKESYPDLDLAPLNDEEIDKRALQKAQAAHRTYETLEQGEKTWGGTFGNMLGGLAAGALDPINIAGMAVAPEAQGIGILATALRWGALAGVSQAGIEFASDDFKEKVQPGYTESGAPIKEIAGAFVGGAVVGGGVKTLGNLWTKVKTGQWPTSVRDAGNVIESEANIADTNIFPGVQGEVAHREALVKTIDDIIAGRPVDVEKQIAPEMMREPEPVRTETGMPKEQLALPLEEAPLPRAAKTEPGPPAPLQTPDEMRDTLTAPDHQEAIRADIDRARAMSDVQVPGIDENGNHVMIGVDKAVDQVDAYKLVAEQLQACANPVQEAAE